MEQETQKIWSLYRITNKINGKIYVGQAQNYKHRWSDHRRAVKLNKPTQIVHHAMIKHGIENFEFEVIATCRTIEDANWMETELVKQYDSFISNGKGYNATLGGMNAPKSEEWIQKMKDWHASLSLEEKAARSKMHSESILQQIAEKGHPAQGAKRTQEVLEKMSKIRLENPVDYTPEKRKNMSEAHLGIKDSEETKQRKSESAKLAWDKRISYDGIKCSAPDCDVAGKAKYKIIGNVRYCNKHGLRLLRYGRLDRISA